MQIHIAGRPTFAEIANIVPARAEEFSRRSRVSALWSPSPMHRRLSIYRASDMPASNALPESTTETGYYFPCYATSRRDVERLIQADDYRIEGLRAYKLIRPAIRHCPHRRRQRAKIDRATAKADWLYYHDSGGNGDIVIGCLRRPFFKSSRRSLMSAPKSAGGHIYALEIMTKNRLEMAIIIETEHGVNRGFSLIQGFHCGIALQFAISTITVYRRPHV